MDTTETTQPTLAGLLRTPGISRPRYQNCRWIAVVLLLAVSQAGFFTAQAKEVSQVPRLALLVGVNQYAHLNSGEQLDGCSNDVAAMRTLLIERFQFRPDQIVTLIDRQATGDAIREALARLAQQIQRLPADSPKAQVVFHFSGHGSQVKDQADGADRDEVDGLDETLVPHDARKQGGSEDLRDDELFEFVEKICGDGRATMWLVLDCCHSGSGARGVGKLRKLNRGFTVKRAAPAQRHGLVKRKLPPGAIMLAACRASEVEPEYEENGVRYGLLTRFLVQVLNEEENVTRLSYGLLRDAILSRYRRDRSVAYPPVPQLEGEARLLTASVLGSTGVDRPRYWEVRKSGADRSAVLIRAGSFHGVTEGSIYEVYELADQIESVGKLDGRNGNSIAWLRIEKVQGATAQAALFRWDDGRRVETEVPSAFERGYAIERYHEHGGIRFRLRIETTNPETTKSTVWEPGDEEVPRAIREAIAASQRSTERPWLAWVGQAETCDVVLRIVGRYAAIFPAGGVAFVDPQRFKTRGDIPPTLAGGWGPFDVQTGRDVAEEGTPSRPLTHYFRAIARARNLLRLANTQVAIQRSTGSGSSKIDVALELVAVDEFEEDGYTPKEWRPWRPTSDGSLVMRHDETYAFRVVNREKSGKPVYVSVLAIDPNMGIDQVLPYQDGADLIGEQELKPGGFFVSEAFDCDGIGFPGQRSAIVLATREPNDFYMLSQPSLPATRSVTSKRNSSLNDLLMQHTYFKSVTRGDSRRRRVRRYDESWSTATLNWVALPPVK